VNEDTRSSYGLRHARAAASAETNFATAARELLDLVDGTAYLTLEVRAVEIAESLDELETAHHGFNNFYTEGPPARRLADLAGAQGDVPEAVRHRYVQLVTECFLGNGHGVSSVASTYYERMIRAFSPTDAGVALRTFMEPGISSILRSSVGKSQWSVLLEILEIKLTSASDRELFDAIRDFQGTPDQLRLHTSIKKLATGDSK